MATPCGVLRSPDDGQSWSLRSGGFSDYGSVNGLAIDRTRTGDLLVAGNELLVSHDRAQTFEVLYRPHELDWWRINTLTVDGGAYYAGSIRRLLFSSDGGATWQARDLARKVSSVLVLDPGAKGRLLVATSDGLLIVNTAPPHAVSDAGLKGEVLSLFRTAKGQIYAGTRNNLYLALRPEGPWQAQGLDLHRVHDVLVEGAIVVVATHLGLFWRSVGSSSWKEVQALGLRAPRTLLVDHRRRLLVGTEGHGLYRGTLPW